MVLDCYFFNFFLLGIYFNEIYEGILMEFIINVAQFEKMIDNKIIGIPELINSKINFFGKNNILVFNHQLKLENVILNFKGDNSVFYIASDLNDFELDIYNNSTCFIGKNNIIGQNIKFNIFESQNVIIGDDCVIADNFILSTSDCFSIYDSNNKERINFANSIYIGDHVWINNNVHISFGAMVGSGSIVGTCSVIPPNSKIPSNMYLAGNPIKIIKKDVFFTKEFLGHYNFDESLGSKTYKSDVFVFNFKKNETLDLDKIDEILKDLDVESRLEFIEKLFVQNKRKNRFYL